MKPLFFPYWGKTGEGGTYHLVVWHCLDVAAVAWVFLEIDPVVTRRFEALTGLRGTGMRAWLALLAALHDIGKWDIRFQMKAPQGELLVPERGRLRRMSGYDHGAGGFEAFRKLSKDWLPVGLSIDRESLLALVRAVCAHHGSFPGSNRQVKDMYKLGPFMDRDVQAKRAVLEPLVQLCAGLAGGLPTWDRAVSAQLAFLLAGFVSVCDWVGSQEDWFPFEPSQELTLLDYWERTLPRARAALLDTGLVASEVRSYPGLAPLISNRPPRAVQALVEHLTLPEQPALVVIEDRMGQGKTEAALSLAARWLARGDARAIYFALPTMATANGMLPRAEKVIPHIFAEDVNLILAHGRRRSNERFQKLMHRATLRREYATESHEHEAQVVCGRWFLSRKRALLGQFGVGTVDQAMQAAMRLRHQFVRAFGLGLSVVIIDEVHAYDVYMETILERLIEWLGSLGAPVVLLSATLPQGRRRDLIDAYLKGAAVRASQKAAARAVLPSDSDGAPYPLVTVANLDGVQELGPNEPPPSITVHLRQLQAPAEERDAAALPALLEAAIAGASVCWIRNTVGDAQRTYAQLLEGCPPEVTPLLFHARYRGTDRGCIEKDVLERFGPDDRKHPGGLFLVATQVIEQSLDLDFDLMASDLAPIDLLLQRTGRLHRHARPIHDRHGNVRPELIVVGPTDDEAARLEFGPSGHVYDPVTLWLTRELLASRTVLEIPGDLRPLIEQVYGTARADLIAAAPNAEKLIAADRRRENEKAKRTQNALQVCIPPAAFDPTNPVVFEDDDDDVQATTRDGRSSILLPVLWDGDEARDLDGHEWRLDPDAEGAWLVARDLTEQLISIPAYPWEQVERGACARGEPEVWDRFERKLRLFLERMHVGREIVIVPMCRRGSGFRGSVQTQPKGERIRLSYSLKTGLEVERDRTW